ncbi:Excinuclease ABC subunit C [hydrothermal vent metagenome]|uniref:Excinuclease ABC subunit C n=1 Tax=hydrothermal vent metagenome TaxID=652676 RepID=A0A3B0ZIT0_9ZZZZ
MSEFDSQAFLKTLTTRPGVYQMKNAEDDILYVGKAKNLKKRVGSYFSGKPMPTKTRIMVQQIVNIDIIITHTENEALLLENNLIKEYKPKYNILLRDDKSYPYLFISTQHAFPRLSFHRGAKRNKGRYFGPYPSAGAVRESLQLLQKLFPIRQCEDSFYQNRSRACLQYQIKRCTAPCVKLISQEAYQGDVDHTVLFLEGKSQQVIEQLVVAMNSAAEALNYEAAARYRDQIANLRRLSEKQYVSGSKGNIDVVACITESGLACVQVFFIRDGRNLGSKTFFPKQAKNASAEGVLTAFLPQYYLGKLPPSEIIINCSSPDQALLSSVLSEQAGHKVMVKSNVRSERARWLAMAENNAKGSIAMQLTNRAGNQKRLESLQDALSLDEPPQRLECFDISHTQGEETVASCVVFENGEPFKSDYRRFNIKNITPGDDYAAMRQALKRRYQRLKEESAKLPDILFIDGGKGQLNIAKVVLEEVQLSGVVLIGVSKGEGRKPGLETLHIATNNDTITLAADSPALHLIQQVRDEAHRFAITGHRQRRAKMRTTSTLEGIPGLGPKRRRVLLSHFGGLQEVMRAGTDDLASVQGISRQLAQKIYDLFHVEGNSS